MKVISAVTASLSEIGHGKHEMKFAFVDAVTEKTITPYCKCKDFFQDMWWSYYENKSSKIYGFSWSPNKERDVLDRNGLCVSLKLCESIGNVVVPLKKEDAENIQALMNSFDKALGFLETTVEQDDDNERLIVYFDKKWSEVPYLNSAFFLLLRNGLTYKKGQDIIETYCSKNSKNHKFVNDIGTLFNCKQKLTDLLNGKVDRKQKYADYESVGYVHGSSGIYSYNNYKID